jgi:RHS repeat-associated protein
VDDRTGEDDDVTSVYDGADRLSSRTEPGAGPDRAETILYFYWGGGASLAEEADGAGNTLVRYACDASGNALAQQSYRVVNGTADPTDTEGTWRWLLSDTDANVATQLNDDGTVAEQSAFDPYGQPQAGGSSVTDPKERGSTLGFQGAITDRASGSVVLGPRLYDPSTARFSTADSFVSGGLDLGLALDPLTGNRYLFAGANPVGYFDDGHAPYVRAPYGHPVGEREPALEFLRQLRERQGRSQPMSLAAARRPPTKDGFCFLGRRDDGRCKGASTFTDSSSAATAHQTAEEEAPHALDGEADLDLARILGQFHDLVAAGDHVEDLGLAQGDLVGELHRLSHRMILPGSDAGPRRGRRQASDSC